jgi:phage repressor protein C with HTH and peptisase S24 domain
MLEEARISANRKGADISASDMAKKFRLPHPNNYSNWVYRNSIPKSHLTTASKIFHQLCKEHELEINVDEVDYPRFVAEPEDRDDMLAVDIMEAHVVATNNNSGFEIQYTADESIHPLFYRKSWLDKRGLDPKSLVARKVTGSSMEPALFDGDKILINTDSNEPRNGRVFAVVLDGNLCVKRLKKKHGEWWVTSDNLAHSSTDTPLENAYQVIGEVVEKSSEFI